MDQRKGVFNYSYVMSKTVLVIYKKTMTKDLPHRHELMNQQQIRAHQKSVNKRIVCVHSVHINFEQACVQLSC